MAAVVAGIALLTGGQDGVSAKPSPRGGLVAVPDKPAALNRPPLVKTWPAPKVVPPANTVPGSGCVRRCGVSRPIDSGSAGPSVPPNAHNPSQVSAWYHHQCNGDAFCIHRLEVEGCTQLMGYNDGTRGGSSDLPGLIADLINQPLPTVGGCDWLCLLRAVGGWDD
jgi:hypothetical protein